MAVDRLSFRRDDLARACARFGESLDRWRSTNDDAMRDSMLKRFEFTFELSWKAAKDWLRRWEADELPDGPRQVLQLAFARGLIADGNGWSVLLDDRNISVHVYDEDKIADIAARVARIAPELFDGLIAKLAEDGGVIGA